MGDYRSRSYADGRMQVERYNTFRPQTDPHDFRSYSTSYASYYSPPSQSPPRNNNQIVVAKDFKLKKNKSNKIKLSSSLKSWGFTDPDIQRRKRVASYKAYTVEGKVKGSLKKSFRWLKNRYTKMLYG